jgi:hypothetical protein
MNWAACPLLGRGSDLETFCSSALGQVYETLYLLFRVQECRFTPSSQDAGITVLSMGDGILICPLGLQTQHCHSYIQLFIWGVMFDKDNKQLCYEFIYLADYALCYFRVLCFYL